MTTETSPKQAPKRKRAAVVKLRRKQDPAIAEVVKLMESTDDLGKQRILGIVEGVLSGQATTQKENAQILQFPGPVK
ncbi:MAG: hypothetical protein RBS40_08115 [Rhodocyclaceae bacterium]|jgi:hypothetical protein|nr:hypothetical protein [Rhodocyclaceae bacterium]